jgi:hypothetical protein
MNREETGHKSMDPITHCRGWKIGEVEGKILYDDILLNIFSINLPPRESASLPRLLVELQRYFASVIQSQYPSCAQQGIVTLHHPLFLSEDYTVYKQKCPRGFDQIRILSPPVQFT